MAKDLHKKDDYKEYGKSCIEEDAKEKTNGKLMKEYIDEWEEKGGSYFEFDYDKETDSVTIIDIYVTSEYKLEIPNFVSRVCYCAWYRNISDRGYKIFIPKGCYIDLFDKNNDSVCTHVMYFEVDEKHELYSSEDGVLYNKDKTILLAYPMFRVESRYTVPESVVRIGYNAFILPNMLEQLIITKNVIDIQNSLFHSSIEIIVDEENSAFKSVNGSLYSKDGKILYSLYIDENGKAIVEEGTIIISEKQNMLSCEELYIASTVKIIGSIDNIFFNGDIEHCVVPRALKECLNKYDTDFMDITYY